MRKLINTVLAGALGLSMIAGVSAQSELDPNQGNAAINVEANADGEFSAIISKAPNFGAIDYSVENTTITTSAEPGGEGDLVIVVTYAKGDAVGWSVNISGEDFTNGETGEALLTFDVEQLTLGTGIVDASPGTQDSVDPNFNQTVTGSAEELVTGLPNVGSNGVFTVTYVSNRLIVPAGTLVDEYTSTLTVSLPAAP